MTLCIEGIDPGAKGAVAFIWPEMGRMTVRNLPTYKVTGTSRTFTYADGEGLADFVEKYRPTQLYLERVHSMPHDGPVGAFAFGDNFGTIKGVHNALRVPITPVEPGIWKSNMGASSDKQQCVARAKTLFPACAHLFTRPDLAEATLIALYGVLHLGHRLMHRLVPLEEFAR